MKTKVNYGKQKFKSTILYNDNDLINNNNKPIIEKCKVFSNISATC